MQLRKEYEEKLREEARRAALEEMEKKRLAALEAEKGEKEKGESKGGEGEKPSDSENEVGRGGGGGGVVGDAHGDQGAGVRVGHSRLLRRRECVAHEMGEL